MTNTKTDLMHVLYEHGIDQILEGDPEDIKELAADFSMDLDGLLETNSNVAKTLIDSVGRNASTAGKGPFARSLEKQTLTHEDKVSLLERLIKTAKDLGLSCTFSLKDIVFFDDVALDFHIAEFQSLLDETEQKRNS